MSAGETGTRPFSRRARTAAAAAALAAAAGLAYGNSLFCPFVFDDQGSILRNPTLRRLGDLGRVLRPPSAGGLTVGGRPVLNLSLALNYAVSGTAVWSYHLLNLLIHLLAGLTLFGIARRTVERMGGRRADLFAFFVALLWMVHPLQTEAVTYVVQRAESLMGLLYLLTLYGFIRGAEGGPPGRVAGWFALSGGCCLLGMGVKEVMVTAPVMVFLYDRTFIAGAFGRAWRGRRAYYLALGACWALLAALVIGAGSRGNSSGFQSGVPWGRYVLTQGLAMLQYLRLSVWPHPLDFYYTARWAHGIEAWAALIAVILAVAASGWALLRGRPEGFLGAWFFGILAPTSLVPGPAQTLAEHRMYLPLAAVVAGLALLLSRLFSRAGPRPVLIGMGAAAAALGCALTAERNRVYGDPIALWQDAVRQSPDNAYAQNALGDVLRKAGRLPEARAAFVRSLELNPAFPDAHVNLGDVAEAQGRPQEAAAEFESALRLDPSDADAHNNLGNILRSQGLGPQALAEYESAVRLKPDDAEAYNGLGTALTDAGRIPEAIAAFQRALALRPDFAQADFNLGVALAASGSLSGAIDRYRMAVRLAPGLVEAHLNLGVVLAQSGRLAEAAEQFEAALRLRPDYAPARENLARVRAQQEALSPP